jgi:hypothetical protein
VVDSLINPMGAGYDAQLLDEFAPSAARSPKEIRAVFTRSFNFGCEGDDPLNTLTTQAMGTPFESKLKTVYGSDIGIGTSRTCASAPKRLGSWWRRDFSIAINCGNPVSPMRWNSGPPTIAISSRQRPSRMPCGGASTKIAHRSHHEPK